MNRRGLPRAQNSIILLLLISLSMSQEAKAQADVDPDSLIESELESEEVKQLEPLDSSSTEPTDAGTDAASEPPADLNAEATDEAPLNVTDAVQEAEAFSEAPAVNDEPNLDYEAQLHNIYVNYYSKPTAEEEWQTLVGKRNAESYRIQRGDNLWNISSTLFGDGNYWPKVWSLNQSIRNPHLISTNNSIQFVLGDESEPPAFTISENVSVNVDIDQKTRTETETIDAEEGSVSDSAVPSSDGAEPEIEIPPPLKVSRPVVKKIPPSLPEWQTSGSRDKFDELGIDYGKRKITEIENTIPLTSFISEVEPESYGSVKEIEVGNSMASAYQYIYVLMKPGQGEVGKTFLAVANRGEVQSVHPSIRGRLGISFDVLGEVQLVEKMDVQRERNTGEMYRALVLKIVNPVSLGAQLVNGQIESVKISEDGPRSNVVAQIVGGSFFNRRQVYGTESVTYINRGAVDGLEVGQILPVRANRKVRNSESLIESNVMPIGWLKIIKVTPHMATAMVVRSWSDIMSGDLTGSGPLLPQVITSTADKPIETAAAQPSEVPEPEVQPTEETTEEMSEDADFSDDEEFEIE